jgi:hypothetical protein
MQPKPPTQIDNRVKEKAGLYMLLHPGWAHAKCDSLGFTALCKMSGGCMQADIYQAQGEPGRWYRSPEKNCYDLGESASDISKDMFAMLLPYLYYIGDKNSLAEIYEYGKANGFVMGRGPYTRTFMTPNMVSLLEQMIGMWEGEEENEDEYYEDKEEIHPELSKYRYLKKAGYAKHLDVIAIVSKSLIKGGVSTTQLNTIKKYLDENPRNALFQALWHRFTDGVQTEAITILMDESLFPAYRLPSTRERCEEYLWQRDLDNYDWKPCNKNQVHDGVDFLIAAWAAGQL